MSVVEQLIRRLDDRELTPANVVVKVLSAEHKDKRVCFCYSGPAIRYVITMFRAGGPLAAAHLTADPIVQCLKQRVAEDRISHSMLHPYRCFELDGHLCLASRYVRPVLKLTSFIPLSLTDFHKLVQGSSEWMLRFQSRTLIGESDFDAVLAFADRFISWSEERRTWLPQEFAAFGRAFLSAWQSLSGRLPSAARHGDYCPCNYFYDANDNFRVFDWEFAAEQDCVACDFFCNIVAYASWLQSTSLGLDNLADLFDEGGTRNEHVRLLQESIRAFQRAYSVSTMQSQVLFVYAYLYQMMRFQVKERVLQRLTTIPGLRELLPV